VARRAEQKNEKRIWLRAGAVILLVAVASLSTLAKNSPYYPRGSQIKYVSIASKMKVANAPVVFGWVPVQPESRLVPPPPAYSAPVRVEPPAPSIQPIGLLVSPLHRPPPAILA
jgi:hypothetical protein